MKKPKVEYISHEPFAVIKNNGEWLDSIETCESYENMIDALIGVIDAIDHLRECGSDTPLLKSKIEIEQVLKDAGCTDD